jgi:hypothetical protein
VQTTGNMKTPIPISGGVEVALADVVRRFGDPRHLIAPYQRGEGCPFGVSKAR